MKQEPVVESKMWRERAKETVRNGTSSSLYFLIKHCSNNQDGRDRVREVGDLLLTTDLSKVFRITKNGEVYAPEMKSVVLALVGPSLMGVRQ